MEDNLSKFLKITGLLLLTVLLFLLAVALAVLGLRFFFGLFGHMSWVGLVYKMLILALPAALFLNVYFQFYRVTRRHASAAIRLISYILFAAAAVSWIYAYVTDLLGFMELSARDLAAGSTVKNYLSYHTGFLATHVVCLILVSVMQALAAPPEKDWLEKAREKRGYY